MPPPLINIDADLDDADWPKRRPVGAPPLRGAYDASQPRVPAGTPGGGRWTDGGAAGSTPGPTEAGLAANAKLREALIGRPLAPGEDFAQLITYDQGDLASRAYHDALDAIAAQMPTLAADDAEKAIRLWAATSGDSDTDAIANQQAINALFDLHAPTDHLGQGEDSDAILVREGRRPNWTKVAKAEYAATQAKLQALGITEVTVYRGIQQEHPIRGIDTVQMQPASSWSLALTRASIFARSFSEPEDAGSLLTTTIPASRILSLPITGRGTVREAEVIVLGGPITVSGRAPAPRSQLIAGLIARLAPARSVLANLDAKLDNADWPKRRPRGTPPSRPPETL